MNTAPDVGRGCTVAELISNAVAKYGDRNAFANDEATLSYTQLGQLISRIAQYFDSLGLKPGDTVAQLGVNRSEVFAVIAAVYMRGLRSVTLHPLGAEADQDFILNDCDAAVVIVDEYHGPRGEALRARCTKARAWLAMGTVSGFTDLRDAIAPFIPQSLKVTGDAETVVRIAYTGGTTGRPKGVMLSNRALLTNIVIDLAVKDWPAQIRYACVAPISHGAGSLVLPTLMRGGCVTLLRSYSANAFIDLVTRYDCNVTWMVPTMLYALLDAPRAREVDWSRFHSLIYSGAPAAPQRIAQALQLFGPILIQSYGQTEAPNSILTLDRHDHAHLDNAQLAAAGRPSPLVRVALLDDDGVEVADGQRGEICVRGPLLMSGYLNNEAETAKALAGGWLHTGDIAYRDSDGLYFIVDRKKDVVISGGFNVYPKEVEDALCMHAAVANAAVIGIPDAKWGEAVMAYVTLKDGCTASAEEISAHVRQAKGAVAAPKRVEFVSSLPLTALGKIDKKALRSRHWTHTERAVN